MLASLNHPNIGSIYGLEEAEGVRALVLELVEGPTLADRIKQGPIPLDEALPIAKQIAEALEAAHEQGVIHRDLKPANIKVREDGTVKVLDFGLAKALDTVLEGDPSQSPTLTAAATQMGVILGTAAYMSPEQARGKTLDRRADIWAFGVVLFEMLTGQRPFQGDDVSLTLAAVMTFEPPLDRLPVDLPPALQTYMARCLEKDPRERVRDIGDVRLALGGAFENSALDQSHQPERRRAGKWAVVTLLTVAAGMAALAFYVGTNVGGPAVSEKVIRFQIPANDPPLSADSPFLDIAVSADGAQVIYRDNFVSGEGRLNVRRLDELRSRPVAGAVGVMNPFVSPNGRWVGFFLAGGSTLMKVPTQGGVAEAVGELPDTARGAHWAVDDSIVVGTAAGLLRFTASGAEPESLTTSDVEEFHSWPSVLPDGDTVLFVSHRRQESTGALNALDLRTGDIVALGLSGTRPHYVDTGHLVYATANGTLEAVAFDADSLEVSGTPVVVLDEIQVKRTGAANFAISDGGLLVYVPAVQGDVVRRSLVWVDRDGREEPIAVQPDRYLSVRVSPDGRYLALEADANVHLWSTTRQTRTRLTVDPGMRVQYPVWTSDSERILFAGTRGASPNLFWKRADNAGLVERLTQREARQFPTSISRDGSVVIVHDAPVGGGSDIHTVSLGEAAPGGAVALTPYEERNGELSPDGRWLAYQSDETGQTEIWVRSFPDVEGGRFQITTSGGTMPVWSPSGRELFYLGAGLMRVPVELGKVFSYDTPELIVPRRNYYFDGPFRNYDVADEGQRFVFIVQGPADARELVAVENWSSELQRLVPTD